MKVAKCLAFSCVFMNGVAFAQSTVTALVVDAYDGDTLTIDAEIWPDMAWSGNVRVRGVDTPEIRGACAGERQLAIAARDYVRELLIDETVILTEIENDRYGGRVLAHVALESGENLADRLIDNGFGRAYDGGRRQGWCASSSQGEGGQSDTPAAADTPAVADTDTPNLAATDAATTESTETPAAARAVVLASAGTGTQTAAGTPAAVASGTPTTAGADAPSPDLATEDPLKLYDDNENGRITCAEAREHGIAPVHKEHPAYPYMTDGDGDGVVCE